ncbi:8-oxo-dGTP diphosphatase [Oceanobacillus sp. FSL K6-2867]|uniref:NUDIX hydrolase n=1 Tax=Oceanobacillus sp. FSL K6-2867 TaxID=2954748 RepID=UPI0030D9EB41
MFKYTICFIRRGDELLMLNREKSIWMGRWNGVGGKVESGETPTECILREVKEETGISLPFVHYKGTVTWGDKSQYSGGMYAYVAELPSDYTFQTPVKTEEGILDWKKVDWVLHPENSGIANLNYYLLRLLEEENTYEYRFIYEGDDVIACNVFPLEEYVPIS